MASTNKTTNYELSQYIGTDKPTYLVDYNGDMLKIDTQMKANDTLGNLAKTTADTAIASYNNLSSTVSTLSDDLDTAEGKIETNENNISDLSSNIGTIANLNTTDKSSLVNATNEVNSKVGTLSNLSTINQSDTVSAINENFANITSNTQSIGNLSNLDTSDKSSLVNASNELYSEISKFNLVNFTQYNSGNISATNCVISSSYLTLATDSSNSIFKLYGALGIASQTSGVTVTLKFNTPLRPDTTYNIDGVGITFQSSNPVIRRVACEVNTSGQITLSWSSASTTGVLLWLPPCLYFNKNFGDTPTA